MTQNNLGAALKAQALQTAGADAAKLLAQAVDAYRDALQVYTFVRFPQAWAATQNNLGAALKEQALQTAEADAAKLLAQAVDAYHDALQVGTRKRFPQDWAMIQNNLGKRSENTSSRNRRSRYRQASRPGRGRIPRRAAGFLQARFCFIPRHHFPQS
jgi:hypothetical protein